MVYFSDNIKKHNWYLINNYMAQVGVPKAYFFMLWTFNRLILHYKIDYTSDAYMFQGRDN